MNKLFFFNNKMEEVKEIKITEYTSAYEDEKGNIRTRTDNLALIRDAQMNRRRGQGSLGNLFSEETKKCVSFLNLVNKHGLTFYVINEYMRETGNTDSINAIENMSYYFGGHYNNFDHWVDTLREESGEDDYEYDEYDYRDHIFIQDRDDSLWVFSP